MAVNVYLSLCRSIGITGVLSCLGVSALAERVPTNEWAFIDNGHVRLGVKLTAGACIGYFSETDRHRNLLNSHDEGRFIQQSYYGDADGTVWWNQSWRWNPIQGGDCKGGRARVLAFKASKTSLYAKTEARHWSGCVALPDVLFEEWITLRGKMAHVRFKMTYSGSHSHSMRSQEVPAFFTSPELERLVLYDGSHPWAGQAVSRSQPGWPNESRNMSEHWAAWVDASDYGVGGCVPVASKLTCYRYQNKKDPASNCSYFAPLVELAITPGYVFEYDLYLTAGTSNEIREAFRQVNQSRKGMRSPRQS